MNQQQHEDFVMNKQAGLSLKSGAARNEHDPSTKKNSKHESCNCKNCFFNGSSKITQETAGPLSKKVGD